MHDELGQLPKSDRNDELEMLSLAAVNNLFSVERFRVRAEQGKDTGVDRYLEVKVDGFDTNFRSQLQLKSREKHEPNTDGSVSKSIEVSNLNYLLNGPCPMYILYIHETKELRYSWAREEAARLDKENHDWMRAESVTFRFQSALDKTSLATIADRIILEARTNRGLQEHLSKATRSESPRLEFESDGTITDPEQAREFIHRSGETVVASGFPQRVVNMSGLLRSEDLRHPKTQLVLAYARYALNRYDLAMGHLRESGRDGKFLTDSDRVFHCELLNACEYKLGRKTHSEFLKKSTAIGDARDGAMKSYARLDELRYRLLASRDAGECDSLLKEIKDEIQVIKESPETSEALILSAKAILLYSEGQNIVSQILSNTGDRAIQSRMQVGGMRDASVETSTVFQAWNSWAQFAVELMERAKKAKHPIVLADVLYTRAAVTATMLMNAVIMAEMGWIRRPDWIEELSVAAVKDAEQAVSIYETADSLESNLRTQLVLAEIQELAGNQEKAIMIAQTVHPVCETMGYVDLAKQASSLVLGQSHFSELRRSLAEAEATDNEALMIEMTDDEAEQMARVMTDTMGLPLGRAVNVLQELLSGRRIALEKRDWCRHIQLHQHLEHTAHAATAYATPPNFRCGCELLDIWADAGTAWEAGIDCFKESNCEKCPHRLP